MLCYFDNSNNLNLSHIPHIKEIRELCELTKRLSESDFTFAYTTEYSQPVVYVIEVSKIPELWCAKTFLESYNVLLNISSKVIKAAKQKKIRIVILSTIAGDNFSYNTFDGFNHLHNTVRLLGLPKHSLCIISGNLNASQQYTEWCTKNSKE